MNSAMDEVTASRVGPIRNTLSRTDLVVQALRTAILSGILKPGDPLVERIVAEDLNVSKTPVREALIILVRNGLVDMKRNRGAVVRELDVADALEVYRARLLLEPWAVYEAVTKHYDEIDFVAAEASLRKADESDGADAPAARVQENRTFHEILYAPCDNVYIKGAIDNLRDLAAMAAATIMWQKWPSWEQESHEHKAILEAAKAGNAERARDLMAQHIQTSIDRMESETGQLEA